MFICSSSAPDKILLEILTISELNWYLPFSPLGALALLALLANAPLGWPGRRGLTLLGGQLAQVIIEGLGQFLH